MTRLFSPHQNHPIYLALLEQYCNVITNNINYVTITKSLKLPCISIDHVTIFSNNNIKPATPPFATCGRFKFFTKLLQSFPYLLYNIMRTDGSCAHTHIIQLSRESPLTHTCSICLEDTINISYTSRGNPQSSTYCSCQAATRCYICIGSYGN